VAVESGVSGIVSAQLEAMKKFEEATKAISSICGKCSKENFDFACAKMMRSVAGLMPSYDIAGALASQLFLAMDALGSPSRALTEKAFLDVCKEKGWITLK